MLIERRELVVVVYDKTREDLERLFDEYIQVTVDGTIYTVVFFQ